MTDDNNKTNNSFSHHFSELGKLLRGLFINTAAARAARLLKKRPVKLLDSRHGNRLSPSDLVSEAAKLTSVNGKVSMTHRLQVQVR